MIQTTVAGSCHRLTVASMQLSPVGRLLETITQVGHAGLDRLAQAGADVSRRRNDSTPPTTMPRHQVKQHVLARLVEPLDESGRLRMPSLANTGLHLSRRSSSWVN